MTKDKLNIKENYKFSMTLVKMFPDVWMIIIKFIPMLQMENILGLLPIKLQLVISILVAIKKWRRHYLEMMKRILNE